MVLPKKQQYVEAYFCNMKPVASYGKVSPPPRLSSLNGHVHRSNCRTFKISACLCLKRTEELASFHVLKNNLDSLFSLIPLQDHQNNKREGLSCLKKTVTFLL